MPLFKEILAAGIVGVLAIASASAQQAPMPDATINGHCSCGPDHGACGSGHCACNSSHCSCGCGHCSCGSGHGAHAVPEALQSHPFVKEMDQDMAKMMGEMHAFGYSGNWDIDFLTMMIPHHQGAIDMARLVLIHGKDPLTRSLAEDIIASQQTEIDAMKARLALLKSAHGTEFPSLDGTRGDTSSTTTDSGQIQDQKSPLNASEASATRTQSKSHPH